MAIEISPTLDNIFHLPSILKIVDIIESEPGLTQSSIIEKTQLGRGTVEDYRKWGIFSGLIPSYQASKLKPVEALRS